jgi:hypothetical protein
MTNDRNAFADVAITTGCDDLVPNIDTVSLIVQQLRTNFRFRFKFVPVERPSSDSLSSFYTCTHDSFYKKKTNWQICVVSDAPIVAKICFFEILIVDNSGAPRGQIVGVTGDKLEHFKGYLEEHHCAIYNSKSGVISDFNMKEKRFESALTKDGDVFSVIVDQIVDKISFFLNGKWLGYGDKKPSQFKEIYVLGSTFYENMGQQIAERYSYHDLVRNKR